MQYKMWQKRRIADAELRDGLRSLPKGDSESLTFRLALGEMGVGVVKVDPAGKSEALNQHGLALITRYFGEMQLAKLPERLAEWLREIQSAPQSILAIHGADATLFVRSIGDPQGTAELLLLVEGRNTSAPHFGILRSLGLTERQAETLFWVAAGKANKEVAATLNISASTVAKHLEQIYRILEVDNRTKAAEIALRTLAANGGSRMRC